MRKLTTLLSLLCLLPLCAQQVQWNTPQAGNPLIPGDFADPTVRKFGDTYYIYATIDGTAGGLGPSQVWISKNFTRGFHRQVAVGRMTFDADGRIDKIVPTHKGIGFLAANDNPSKNIVLDKKVKEKDIFLLVEDCDKMTLGCKSTVEFPFYGYLHKLEVYDVQMDSIGKPLF